MGRDAEKRFLDTAKQIAAGEGISQEEACNRLKALKPRLYLAMLAERADRFRDPKSEAALATALKELEGGGKIEAGYVREVRRIALERSVSFPEAEHIVAKESPWFARAFRDERNRALGRSGMPRSSAGKIEQRWVAEVQAEAARVGVSFDVAEEKLREEQPELYAAFSRERAGEATETDGEVFGSPTRVDKQDSPKGWRLTGGALTNKPATNVQFVTE
jgi:hypothetical protein